MNESLTLLLEIQDLRSKLAELESDPEMEAEAFQVDIPEAAARLRAKIDELVEGLAAPVQRRYRQVADSIDRVVVPVIDGICYGCFVSIPSATARVQDPNQQLQTCQTCGRFLYIVQ